MKRRSFLQASAAVLGSAALARGVQAAEGNDGTRELYELRIYSHAEAKRALLDEYLGKAFVPALKRYGMGPVGVFFEKGGQDQPRTYVLIVHHSAEQVITLPARLAADEDHQKAAKDYLAAKPTAPVYSRIDCSLLRSIGGMPKLARPDTSKPRLLNLRVYESHNERAARKKIEMFDKHELAIFRRVGLTPVLFGETLVGCSMPNLTYMLVFPNEAARAAAWSKFGSDSEWLKLKAMPEYADKEIVSKITNRILTPAPYSEI